MGVTVTGISNSAKAAVAPQKKCQSQSEDELQCDRGNREDDRDDHRVPNSGAGPQGSVAVETNKCSSPRAQQVEVKPQAMPYAGGSREISSKPLRAALPTTVG